MDLSRVRHGESPFLALLRRVRRYPCLGMSGYSQRTHSRYLLRIIYRLARLAQRLQHPLLLTLLLPLSHAALRTPLRNSTCTPLAPAGAEGARRSSPRPSRATSQSSLARSPVCRRECLWGLRRPPPGPSRPARSPRQRGPAPSLAPRPKPIPA